MRPIEEVFPKEFMGFRVQLIPVSSNAPFLPRKRCIDEDDPHLLEIEN
jgi:hypothetical protein